MEDDVEEVDSCLEVVAAVCITCMVRCKCVRRPTCSMSTPHVARPGCTEEEGVWVNHGLYVRGRPVVCKTNILCVFVLFCINRIEEC